MGKRVLVSLLAAALIFLAAARVPAQDTAKPAAETDADPAVAGFKPGKFFTQDDFEHMQVALACLNLRPEDLEYNKVLRDDRLRLKVCDESLNNPLGVPKTAEDAAEAFSAEGKRNPDAVLDRVSHARKLLDVPDARWVDSPDLKLKQKDEWSELRQKLADASSNLDSSTADKASKEYEALRNAAEKAAEEYDFATSSLILGDNPHVVAMEDDPVQEGDERLPLASLYLLSLADVRFALMRQEGAISNGERSALAAVLPEQVFEASDPIPGSTATDSSESLFDLAAKSNWVDSLAAAARTYRWADLFKKRGLFWFDAEPGKERVGKTDHHVPGVTGGIVACWSGEWGKFVIGGTGPNTYEGDDFIGIIDLGGDDTYKGRVACGIGLEGQAPISFVLDLSGDDRYLGEDFTQGFGFMGVGILHDLGGGADTYKSRFCAQGCGLCGYGELYDDGGDDLYLADSGAQGVGMFGYGQLTDAGGDDVYRGARYVQGVAQVMGVGVLTDGAGNDLYYAGGKYLHLPLWNDRYQSLSQGFAIGNRRDSGGGTGGGVALLLDEGDGNDVYQADIYGQGSSYWYSLGMLVDTGGNDTYTLCQYGQGGGIHLSTGILVDMKGNDSYTNPYGVGLGGAHDWAVGWLIDRDGNDLYQGNGQGQGLNFAFGVLMDCAGNDSHSTNNEMSIGKGSNNDISLLLDFAGKDVYGPTEVLDGKFTRRGEHQLVYDVPAGWFPGIDESTLPTVQDPPPVKTVVQHILIAWDDTGVETQKAERSKAEAEVLAASVLKLARKKGANWAQLQTEYNEDSAKGDGFDNTHASYTATPEAGLVKAFKDLALSLGVGQIDICESKFGYHIIKRIE